MNKIKVYAYNKNGIYDYRGTDYSSYVLQGAGNIEKLNQEVDTSTIVLQGLSFREEFTPHTKFIIDECDGVNIINTWHRVVQQDTVSQPILSDNNYFTHTLALSEPSIIAQQRLVDNMSITYKLKDVSLETRISYDLTLPMTNDVSNQPTIVSRFYKETTYERELVVMSYRTTTRTTYAYGKYIDWQPSRSGATNLFEVCDENGNNVVSTYYNLISTYPKIKFIIPRAGIKVGVKNNTTPQFSTNVGFASIKWTINEYAPNSSTPVKIASGTIKSNSVFNSNDLWKDRTTYMYNVHLSNTSDMSKYCLLEYVKQCGNVLSKNGNVPKYYFRQYSSSDGSDLSNQTLYTDAITVQDGYKYDCVVELMQYSNNIPYSGAFSDRVGKTNSVISYGKFTERKSDFGWIGLDYNCVENIGKQSNEKNTKFSTEMQIYSSSSKTQVLSSALPYNAFNVIRKALLCSKLVPKQKPFWAEQNAGELDYISSVDIQHTTTINNITRHTFAWCPFYIDDNIVEELELTQVNETFYNQKNLWEVLIEVGHYIHAIPEIKFGDNNKFMITFNKLGKTEQGIDNATKMTIMNFKGVDDYICATSSYISNMVQLGGQITEKLTPKTQDEKYIVSNDTSCIITSKPIIELLEIKAIPLVNYTFSAGYTGLVAGTEYDITNFVYEKNIYNILSMRYNDEPNKGIALYYELGDNVIKGFDYQLPQANTNMYSDYTIKKVLFLSANTYPVPLSIPTEGEWSKIKVNDFVFKITYRTKDDVRENHLRPDIRKYLVNSYCDFYPQHNQFNNQEDILVDSIAFGSKMYGTLIRTGNTTYQETEWVDRPIELKHKGELYNIYGNLYYVAQVSNTYYADHIESVVEYSKDYNQLSQIISIPSEPRFYEISEQSSIRRDVNIQDFLVISSDGTDMSSSVSNNNLVFLYNIAHLKNLMFNNGTDFAKWVLTTFKGDKQLGNDYGTFGERELVKNIFSPINAYSSGSTLTYEWDMVDNFGAGDYYVDNITPSTGTTQEIADGAYSTLRSYQYCDMYGKATLTDFYILEDYNVSNSDVKNLPQSPINPWNGTTNELMNKNILATNQPYPIASSDDLHERGLILLKDCREAISFNYNLSAITNSDTFVVSPYIFSPNKTSVKAVFLNKEVDKLSNGFINSENIMTIKDEDGVNIGSEFDINQDGYYETTIPYSHYGIEATNYFGLTISYGIYYNYNKQINEQHFNGGSLEQIKAIAVICEIGGDSGSNKRRLVLARNIPSTYTRADATATWHFGSPITSFFANR